MIHGAQRMQEVGLSSIRAVLDKAKALEAAGHSIIHLEMGEPDFDTPAHVVQAAQAALAAGQTHYAPNRGLLELRQAIAAKLAADNGIAADPEQEIIVTVGAAEALFMAFAGYLNPGDEVIIPEPAYISYVQLSRLLDAVPVSVPATEADNWQVDPEVLEKAITPRSKMIVLNTPNNPTGTVYSRTFLEAVAALAQKYNLLVVMDEVYEKIIYPGCEHFSMASLPGMRERAITVNGYSKAYAMTGWRLGYVAADKSLILPMLKVHQYTSTCLTTFAQIGAVAAMNGPQQCVTAMVTEFQRRRDLIFREINAIEGLSCLQPQGAFYAFINIKKLGLASANFVDVMQQKAGVSIVPGNAFGTGGEGYVRMSYANSYENLVEAMRRLKIGVAGLASAKLRA